MNVQKYYYFSYSFLKGGRTGFGFGLADFEHFFDVFSARSAIMVQGGLENVVVISFHEIPLIAYEDYMRKIRGERFDRGEKVK